MTQSREDKTSSFVKQAMILAGATLFVRFLGFLYRWPLTNLIGDLGNMYYGASYSIYLFFLILSSAGLPAAISKLVSERITLKQYANAHNVFKTAIWVSIVIGTVAAAVLALTARQLAPIVSYPESYVSIITLAPTLLIVSVLAVFRGYFQGMKNSVPTAVSQVLEQLLNAIFSIVLAYILLKRGPEYGAAGATLGTGVGAVTGLLVMIAIYFMARPKILSRVQHDVDGGDETPRRLAIEIVRITFPIIIGSAIFSIAGLIDTFMIKNCLSASGAFNSEQIKTLFGQYSGKYVVLTTLPVSISTAIATASIPNVASAAILNDRKTTNKRINLGLRMSMIISIPAAIGLGILGEPIVEMLFPRYPEGGQLLQVGAASVIFLALTQIVTGMLQGIGKVKIPVYAAMAGVTAKIICNYVLLTNPAINIYGAVISAIVCYTVTSAINLFFLYRITGTAPDFMGLLIKPLAGSAVMGAICYAGYTVLRLLTGNNTISVLLSIAISGLTYFGVMLVIKGIDTSDIGKIPVLNKLKL